MTPNDARYILLACALVLAATAWGLWTYRMALLDRLADGMCRVACRCWGHDWQRIERADVGDRWAVCASCGARRVG